MHLKLVSRRLVISGTLFIWLIKFAIRPLQHFDEPLQLILGILPNLAGSFLVPFGAYWFFSGKDFLLARIFRIRTAFDLRLVCLLGFGMLVVNEYLQKIPVFGRTFDYNDILSSFIGLLLSWFVFGRLLQRTVPVVH
ncbi:MAG TPA: hypothetical protein VFV31_07200 [Chitinophagaceae bacterium]|nr:hypothetical protein [Chitinophagaceae bacterium]